MIDKREILEAASALGLLPNVVEKDYVLGWMLAGINAHEELAETWSAFARTAGHARLESGDSLDRRLPIGPHKTGGAVETHARAV